MGMSRNVRVKLASTGNKFGPFIIPPFVFNTLTAINFFSTLSLPTQTSIINKRG